MTEEAVDSPFQADPCSEETTIVRVGKTLDFRTAHTFRMFCQEQLETGMHNFVLDFSETRVLDSTGLGAIFMLHRMSMGEVVFAAVTRPVQTVVQLTSLQRVFRQFPAATAACEALKRR